MTKTEKLLKNINLYIEKADDNDELKELIKDFPEVERLIKAVDKFETVIGKLLRNQRKEFIKSLKQFLQGSSTTSDNALIGAIVDMVVGDALDADDFDKKLSKEAIAFFTATVSDLTDLIMESIDKDIAFNTLSNRTLTWIDDWSADLGKLMKLSTHKALEKELKDAIAEGASIQDLELRIKDMPEFNRNRARATAITEVLTASSVSQQEAYLQSPAVTGKKWLHSGSRGIKPRPAHVALNGTIVDVDDWFDVNGYDAKYPRHTVLPAKERVYCHCVLSPAVDEKILGLSQQEKETIRQRTMASL